MNIPAFPSDLMGWLALIGLVAVAYFVVRRSDIQGIREANKDLRDRLDDKDGLIADLQKQLNGFREELAKLRGILEEKDKRIDALSNVHVSTSPEMMAYMQDGRAFMTQMHNYMADNGRILIELNQRSKTK